MSADPLLPDPAHLHTAALGVDADGVVVTVGASATAASCPLCRRPSERVHSRYVRQLADLPWRGVAVRLRLRVRRFFCDTAECRRRIFAERLPGAAPAYARRTARLTDILRAVGLAAGGEGGARLLVSLALQASADTLLRLVRSAALPARQTLPFRPVHGRILQHPDKVRRLVVFSSPSARSGWYPEAQAGMSQIDASMAETMLQTPTGKLSQHWPEPQLFPRLFDKMGKLMSEDYDWSADIVKLPIPVLLVFADNDSMPQQHIAEFFAVLGGGVKGAG